MADRRPQEGSEKKIRFVFFYSSFHLTVARSAAKSFSLAAGSCLDRALRRITKKKKNCQLFRRQRHKDTYDFDPDSTKQL